MSALCQKRTHALQQYPPNLIASGAVTQKPRRTNFSLQWRLRKGSPQKETPSLVRTQVGVGEFVASLRLLSWAARIQGDFLMQLSSAIRAALIALAVTGAGLTTVYADFGGIQFNVIKAGFVVGGSGGSGTLVFHGRRYPISIGGVSYGFTFGASATDFVGTVSNIRTPFDVNGVYGAAGAGVAVGPGAGGIVLANQNGAVLTISGRQMGLIVAADLNGLVITLR